jgi:hypothetical protein
LRCDPRTLPIVLGSMRSTSSAQVLVQSCGQTDGTVSTCCPCAEVAVMRRL